MMPDQIDPSVGVAAQTKLPIASSYSRLIGRMIRRLLFEPVSNLGYEGILYNSCRSKKKRKAHVNSRVDRLILMTHPSARDRHSTQPPF